MTRALRDSGVGWLGMTPDDWPILPSRALFGERKQKSNAVDVHLTPSQKYGVLPQAEYMEITGNKVVLNLSSADNMRHVEAGDYISHLRSFQGGLEFAGMPGKVSAAYTVLKSKLPLEPRFFKYLFKSDLYIQALQTTTDQLRDGQSIRYGQFTLIPLPYPALDEQRAIADYLDRETAQIDAFIAKNEELITLLTERRFALISHSVNAGLEPSLPVVESGNEWLGSVPRHWRVLKLRHVLAEPITDGPHITPDFLEDGVPFLSVDGIVDGELDFQRCRYVSQEDHQDFSRKAAPIRGDILMGKAASVGKIARVKTDRAFSIWSPLALLRPAPTVLPAYIELCLKSASAQAQFAVFANYNTQANISMGDIGEVLIAMPTLDEQGRIVEAAEEELRTIDDAIDAAQRSIELARERRAALISAAVTGKIDVGVAA